MQKPHPIVFGETLFDCFSDGSAVLGGAPFNVAWHLQGFGLAPVVIGRVGMDQRGRDILQSMSRWGMTTAFMQNDPDHPTGSVEITTHNGEPLFRINPDQAYGHIEMPAQELPSEVPLVYHGTLAVWNSAAREVLDALKDRFNAPVFVDVNLRSPWWDNEDVHSLVADATWVKMNVEELQLLFPDHEDENRRVQELYNRYAVEVFILTKGSEGAKFYLRNGTTRHVRPAERLEVIDTVGAGDAFSAVCIVGYIHGWDIEKTLVHAQEFASKIVTKRGAVMQDPAAYAELLNRWLQNV